jgi:mono/diheme cytochrome c family protein
MTATAAASADQRNTLNTATLYTRQLVYRYQSPQVRSGHPASDPLRQAVLLAGRYDLCYHLGEQSVKRLCAATLSVTLLAGIGAQSVATESNPASDTVDRGRYIARVSGCNDCHTPGYLQNDGNIPVDQWMLGDSLGWRGPWGTTYPPNLRLFARQMTESQWVEALRTLRRRPPMPWFNVNEMNEADSRALYRFILSLGDPGEPAPAYLPPGVEPKTPYALFPSPPSGQ